MPEGTAKSPRRSTVTPRRSPQRQRSHCRTTGEDALVEPAVAPPATGPDFHYTLIASPLEVIFKRTGDTCCNPTPIYRP